jgi:hypothetical protein
MSLDEYTGDQAADAVEGAFLDLAKRRAVKPTLAQVVAALEAASAQAVHVDGVDPVVSAPRDLVQAARTALAGLDSAYQREFGRPPTLNEVLYTFDFCFGGMPESMVSGPVPSIIRFQPG